MHKLRNRDVLEFLRGKKQEQSNFEEYETMWRGKSRKKNSCKWLRLYLREGKKAGWANDFREVSRGSVMDVPMGVE